MRISASMRKNDSFSALRSGTVCSSRKIMNFNAAPPHCTSKLKVSKCHLKLSPTGVLTGQTDRKRLPTRKASHAGLKKMNGRTRLNGTRLQFLAF